MKISTHHLAMGLCGICLLALALALVAQYGFGLRPCNLCLIQRGPFVLAAVLSALALKDSGPERARLLLRLAGLVLVVNGAIAVYHVGVEQHWWVSAVCSGGAPAGPISVEDLMAEMNRPAEAQCDSPPWSFHGITMAGLNVPFSFGLGLLTLALLRRNREA